MVSLSQSCAVILILPGYPSLWAHRNETAHNEFLIRHSSTHSRAPPLTQQGTRGYDELTSPHNSPRRSAFPSLRVKMADRRRRRRRASQDSEEEDESASGSESGRSSSAGRKSRGKDPEPVESPVERVATKRDDESECVSVWL